MPADTTGIDEQRAGLRRAQLVLRFEPFSGLHLRPPYFRREMAKGRGRSRIRDGATRRRPVRHRSADLDRASWLDFLATVIQRSDDPSQSLVLNGRPISDSQRRALHRWEREGCSPSFFGADRFLVAIGLHLNDYFLHCLAHGLEPWATGQAPPWHDEKEWSEGLWTSQRRR